MKLGRIRKLFLTNTMIIQQQSSKRVMYKALIFDLGNVIFQYTFETMFEIWARLYNVPIDKIRKQFKLDDMFEKFERGDISPNQFRTHISTELGFELTEHNFELGWNAIYLDKVNGIDQLLIELKKDYSLVALTNTNVIHSKIWPHKYSTTLQHFENVFSSCEHRARKPEPKAFEIVLSYLNVAPDQTIFLDDNMKYVETAKKIGMQAICVVSFEQMLIDLKKLNVI